MSDFLFGTNTTGMGDLNPQTFHGETLSPPVQGGGAFAGGFGAVAFGKSGLSASSSESLRTNTNVTGGAPSTSWLDTITNGVVGVNDTIAKAVGLPTAAEFNAKRDSTINSGVAGSESFLGLPSQAEFESYFVRGIVILIGLIFIAVGLSMFKATAPIITGMKGAVL